MGDVSTGEVVAAAAAMRLEFERRNEPLEYVYVQLARAALTAAENYRAAQRDMEAGK